MVLGKMRVITIQWLLMPWSTTKRFFLVWLPFAIILAYVLIAAFKIRFPGTQYDEALYLNAALGGVDKTTFLTKTFHGFPILLMPYIGAIKAYIFFPVFAVFGVTPLTMRLPGILLTAASLYILYRLLNRQVGQRLVYCILALTAFDASFIMFTRLDNGPVVLDFLLKMLGLAVLLSFARKPQLKPLVIFWLIMLAGVFNKLNFIWYVNAFVAAFALVYGLDIWRKQKPRARLQILALSVAGYLMCVGYYLYIAISYHLSNSFGFLGWSKIYSLFAPVVNGTWFYNYALSPSSIGNKIVFWLVLGTLSAGLLCFLWALRRRQKPDRTFAGFYIFTGLSLLLLLVELAITKSATAGWHYFSIYPLLGIILVLSLEMIGRTLLPSAREAASAFVVVLVCVFCAYQLSVYYQYTKTYGQTTLAPYWSSVIYQLSDFAKARQAQFISLDWGTQTALMGFDPVPDKYFQLLGPVLIDDPVQNSLDYQSYIANKPGAYYITHSAGKIIFPEVTRDFFVLAEDHGYHQIHVATIIDGSTPIFEIYQLNREL